MIRIKNVILNYCAMKRFVPQGFREKGGLLCGYFCFAWLLNPSVPLLEFENEIARLGGILSLFTRQCREMQTIEGIRIVLLNFANSKGHRTGFYFS